MTRRQIYEMKPLGNVSIDPFPSWKRFIDILASSIGFLLLSPLLLIIAAVIKLSSPGPAILKQKRVGRGGEVFDLWKFRTMRPGVDTTIHREHLNNLMNSDTPMTKLDVSDDPRILPAGRIIRRLYLDELPQLMNVLRGEMSLVGPRPCLPYEAEQYSAWHRGRFRVLPGMTGLWQVSGKNKTTFAEMIRLDIEYADRCSLLLDLKILLRTVPAILSEVMDRIAERKSGTVEPADAEPGNKEEKINYASFGKNALLYSFGTMAIRFASFLLIPIYTYSLSVADYGLLSVLLQTTQIMVIVISIGSRTALVRFAREYEKKNEIGTLIGTSVFINFLGAAAVTGVSALLLLPLFNGILHADNALRYVLLTCAAATTNCLAFHLIGYYRADQKGLKVTAANLGAAVSLIGVTAFFVLYLKWGIEGALVSQTIIYGLLSIALLMAIRAQTRLSISFGLTWDLIRFGLPLILVMGGGLITQTSALYFLSYFKGLDQAGIYSLGFKIAAIAEMVLILPFEMAYEPFVYRHIGYPDLWNAISRALTYLIVAFVFIACGIVFVARDLLPLIAPPAFSPAYLVMFLVLPGFAFRGVYYIGESLLFLEKRTDIAGTVVMSFTAMSVLLNYAFIWMWGMSGAAAVFVLTTVLTGSTVLKIGLKIAPVPVERKRLFVCALLLFSFLLTVYLVRGTSTIIYYSVVPLVVAIGAFILYGTRFIRDDEKRVIQQVLGRAQRIMGVEHV
jgi:lipopolysaccharide/colanic/teichoic acid biosynthesis glycosyltransferase/O-antigen/teichoic acid export membrane protein